MYFLNLTKKCNILYCTFKTPILGVLNIYKLQFDDKILFQLGVHTQILKAAIKIFLLTKQKNSDPFKKYKIVHNSNDVVSY